MKVRNIQYGSDVYKDSTLRILWKKNPVPATWNTTTNSTLSIYLQ